MTADDALVIAPDLDLGLDDWAEVVDGGRKVRIEEGALAAMDRAFQVAVQRAASERTYGVGTGFGPMIRVDIPPEEVETLQYNLVRSHAMGIGTALFAAAVAGRVADPVAEPGAQPIGGP